MKSVHSLTREQQKELLLKAYELRTHWWFDELDCNISLARQRIDVSFEEAMSHFGDRAIVYCQMRHEPETYLEAGFRAMTDPDYFLWIIVPEEKAGELWACIQSSTTTQK